MTDDLKPDGCPCCGKISKIYTSCGGCYFVQCLNCGMMSDTYLTKAEAIAAWNTRAEPIGNADELPIRSEVKTFAEFMEVSLKLNDYKGGWRNETPEWLMSRLKDEVQELQAALDFALYNEEKIGECVDVANYAMMIADVLSLRREDAE